MRLSPTAAVFALVCALLTAAAAGAAVDGPVVKDGHILAPLRAPIERSGATVTWSDAVKTGVASYAGHEPIRAMTNFDVVGVDEVGVGDASNDPSGRVLFVWLWLLPISGILCLVAYVYVVSVMNSSLARSAARRGVKTKKLGLFV